MLIHRANFILAIFSLLIASCAPAGAAPEGEPPESAAETPASLELSPPAEADVLLPTPALEEGPRQAVIYDNGQNIFSVEPVSGENRVLISRDELEAVLPPDRSAESYTFGEPIPLEIDLAPDLSSALIRLCATLDARFRCGFDYYVYTLENKRLTQLPRPPGLHGVHWQWSLDGSALAGAGWTYDNLTYTPLRFYAVQKDGSGLQSPQSVNNEHWRIAWHPGGRVILPLTYVASFVSLFVDGSPNMEISIPELAWNDKIECLSFSPDYAQVALVVRGELPKNHDRFYVARSDFTAPVLLAEYDVDARYTCEIRWSPDQNFVSVGYAYDPLPEMGQQANQALVPLGKVIRLDDHSLSELPPNSRICLWSPEGVLLYEKAGLAGEGGRIEALSPPAFHPVDLPRGLTSLTHCPLRWLDEAPALDIPEGIPTDSACHPGETYKDKVNPAGTGISPLFDLIEATSILDGETLEVFMTLDVMTNDLTAYLTSGVTQYFNGWEVLVDIDNNLLTGDILGADYRLSVVVRPPMGGNPAALGSAILKFDRTANKYFRADALALAFRTEERILAMKGTVPGINEHSRLIFLSRVAQGNNNANPNFGGDQICD